MPLKNYYACQVIVSEESMSLLERFVVLMYDLASDIRKVNDAR